MGVCQLADRTVNHSAYCAALESVSARGIVVAVSDASMGVRERNGHVQDRAKMPLRGERQFVRTRVLRLRIHVHEAVDEMKGVEECIDAGGRRV